MVCIRNEISHLVNIFRWSIGSKVRLFIEKRRINGITPLFTRVVNLHKQSQLRAGRSCLTTPVKRLAQERRSNCETILLFRQLEPITKKSFDLSQASPHQSARAAAVQINYTPSRHKFQSISRLHCQWAPRVNLSIRPITFVLFVGHTSIHKFTSNRESRKKSQQGSERTMNFTQKHTRTWGHTHLQ